MASRAFTRRLRGGVRYPNSLHLPLAAAILIAAASIAPAQAPEARLVAAAGPLAAEPTWETTLAAGPDMVMSVYRVGPVGVPLDEVGYAIAKRVEQPPPLPPVWTWIEQGLVPPGEITGPWDPCVAYDPLTGDFVLVAVSVGGGISVAIYDSSAEDFIVWPNGGPYGWNSLVGGGDKPWIVAGSVIPGLPQAQQEFYICYNQTQVPGRPAYLRSIDGGYTWQGGQIMIDGSPLTDWVNPQAAVNGNGPLYAAVRIDRTAPATDGMRVIKGLDPVNPQDLMTWTWLESSTDVPLEIPLYVTNVQRYVPTDFSTPTIGQLAVDPYSSGKLYLVYHDLVQAPVPPPLHETYDFDVDVFLQVLSEMTGGNWSAGNRVRVNDADDPGAETPIDQFLPAVTVTPGPSGTPSSTRVHVIFYDDRNFDAQIDKPAPAEPKCDAFYAYSLNGGVSFVGPNRELEQNPYETCVNYEHVNPNADFGLRDYIGIASQAAGATPGFRIWTSFPGTHAADEPGHKSVIYSSQIPWTSP